MGTVSRVLTDRKLSEMGISDSVHSCVGHTTIAEVVGLLQASHVGSVVVVEPSNNHPVGIFTERDYLMKVACKGLDESTEQVHTYMTSGPVCFTQDDSIGKALVRMDQSGFRHIIITDQSGALTGIISVRDIMKFLINMFSS